MHWVESSEQRRLFPNQFTKWSLGDENPFVSKVYSLLFLGRVNKAELDQLEKLIISICQGVPARSIPGLNHLCQGPGLFSL